MISVENTEVQDYSLDKLGETEPPKRKSKKKQSFQLLRFWLAHHAPSLMKRFLLKILKTKMVTEKLIFNTQETVTEKKRPFQSKRVKKTPATWENDINKNDIITFRNWVYDLGPKGETIYPEFIPLVTEKTVHLCQEDLRRKRLQSQNLN